MPSLIDLKQEILASCHHIVDDRISELNQSLAELQDATGEETKSSAGDKYETTRAMLHLEKEKVAAQLDTLLKQKKVLTQISGKPQKEGGIGSLVHTDKGYFFISISLGKMDPGESVICLSPVSPLGKSFKKIKRGMEVVFGKTKYQVLDLV